MADIQFHLNNPLFSFYYFEHHHEVVSFATQKIDGQTCFRYTNLVKATRRTIHYDRDNYLLDSRKCLHKGLKSKDGRPSPLFLDLFEIHRDLRRTSGCDYNAYLSAIGKMKVPDGAGILISTPKEVLWERDKRNWLGHEPETLLIGAKIEYRVHYRTILSAAGWSDTDRTDLSALEELFE